MLTKFVQASGINMFVRTAGAKGEPIIFIHGALLNSDLWIRQINDLARGWRCFAYDLRGHGRTGPSHLTRYTSQLYADDLLGLLDALALEKPILCGLSLGGMIAQTFADKYPDRVSRLILCDTGVSTRYFLSDRLYNSAVAWTVPFLIPSLGVPRFRQFTHRVNQYIGHREWVSKSGEGLRFAQIAMEKVDPGEMVKIFGAVLSFNGTTLRRPDIPTLIVNGEFDSPLIMRQAGVLQRLYPNADYRVIPVASHLSNLDNPMFFRLTLERFLGPGADRLETRPDQAEERVTEQHWLSRLVLSWRNQKGTGPVPAGPPLGALKTAFGRSRFLPSRRALEFAIKQIGKAQIWRASRNVTPGPVPAGRKFIRALSENLFDVSAIALGEGGRVAMALAKAEPPFVWHLQRPAPPSRRSYGGHCRTSLRRRLR
jgi:3-oxoadipate enol-lactonase